MQTESCCSKLLTALKLILLFAVVLDAITFKVARLEDVHKPKDSTIIISEIWMKDISRAAIAVWTTTLLELSAFVIHQ